MHSGTKPNTASNGPRGFICLGSSRQSDKQNVTDEGAVQAVLHF